MTLTFIHKGLYNATKLRIPEFKFVDQLTHEYRARIADVRQQPPNRSYASGTLSIPIHTHDQTIFDFALPAPSSSRFPLPNTHKTTKINANKQISTRQMPFTILIRIIHSPFIHTRVMLIAYNPGVQAC